MPVKGPAKHYPLETLKQEAASEGILGSCLHPGGHLQDKLTSTSGCPLRGTESLRKETCHPRESSILKPGARVSQHAGKHPSRGGRDWKAQVMNE